MMVRQNYKNFHFEVPIFYKASKCIFFIENLQKTTDFLLYP